MVDISPREAEVLTLVGEQLTNPEIAARLYISVRTVESHVSSLLRKLDVDDRRALAALAAAGPADVAPPATGDEGGGRLRGAPEAFTTFVGRDDDLQAVTSALGDARLVTLTGPGGIGKTRLAIEVGNRSATPRAWFVDLVPAAPNTVIEAVAAALGVADRPNQSLIQVVCDSLIERPGLLVLDNCEHVLDAVATTAERLLRWSPEVVVLATSREPIGLPGERVVPVAPLGVDGHGGAVTLLRERALAAGAVLGPAEDAAVVEICDRLDGLPLAIELAAARCATLGVEGVLRGLDDRFQVLRGHRGGDERHRSLRAVLDWSYELLDPEEQSVLHRSSIFQGGFRLADAEAVAGGDLSGVAVIDAVGRLAAKSLVARSQDPSGSRFRLLETVRAYAFERLDASGLHDEVADAHLAWAVEEAGRLEDELLATGQSRYLYDLVVDDLRSALLWAEHRGARADGHVLARRMAHLAYGRRFLIEARVRYEEAASLAPDGREAALDLLQAGHSASALMHGDVAHERFLEAADRAEEVGEPRTAAIALALAAERPSRMMATFPKLPDRAVILEHLARAHALGDGLDAEVAAYLAVADAWTSVERGPSSTRSMAEDAVAATRAAADPVTESSALDALAAAAWDEGEMAESARICLDRSRLLPRMEPHDPRCGTEIIDTLHMGADGPLALGDLDVATEFAEHAVDHPLAGGALHLLQRELVVGYCLTGRFAEAVTHGDIMRSAWQRIGGPTAGWMAPATYLLALVHGLLGHRDESDEWMEFSHEMSMDDKNAVGTFAVMRLALHEGRFDDATTELDRYAEGAAIADPDFLGAVSALGYAPYVWAIACDVWAGRGEPGAAEWIREVRAATPQHLWAAPCLLRAEGRLAGDDALLLRAAEGFASIGARFEQAVTESLLSGDGAERGREALRELGCAPEQRP